MLGTEESKITSPRSSSKWEELVPTQTCRTLAGTLNCVNHRSLLPVPRDSEPSRTLTSHHHTTQALPRWVSSPIGKCGYTSISSLDPRSSSRLWPNKGEELGVNVTDEP